MTSWIENPKNASLREYQAIAWRWWLMFYGHFSAHARLNGPSDVQRYWGEIKDERPFIYAHTEIRTQAVVICDPTRYQLDHGGATGIAWNIFSTYGARVCVVITADLWIVYPWRWSRLVHITEERLIRETTRTYKHESEPACAINVPTK